MVSFSFSFIFQFLKFVDRLVYIQLVLITMFLASGILPLQRRLCSIHTAYNGEYSLPGSIVRLSENLNIVRRTFEMEQERDLEVYLRQMCNYLT